MGSFRRWPAGTGAGSALTRLLTVGTLAVAIGFTAASACSTFCLRNGEQLLFGKNYDWQIGDGQLLVNLRGLEKTADPEAHERPARWISKYGSVTFNQYGREFPMGGINEAGLAIELMWLDGSRYPSPDDRPALGNLRWIQYQLDRHATVADVLASDAQVRISSRSPLHYLVADRTGAVATVEFLDGKLVAHTGDALPVAALTNDRYDASVAYLAGSTGKDRRGVWGGGSLDRFARAARRIDEFTPRDRTAAVEYAFATLKQVAQPSTRWSIVYELDAGELHFRTRQVGSVRSLQLAAIEFGCPGAPRYIDLNDRLEGDIGGKLAIQGLEENREQVRRAYRGTGFLSGVSKSEIDRVARLGFASTCRP